MLKEYEIQISGKSRKVLIKEREANRFSISVDGRELQVNCDTVPSFGRDSVLGIESAKYDVSLSIMKPNGEVDVAIGGLHFRAFIAGEREQKPVSPAIIDESKKERVPEAGVIYAPMSGRIRSIAVSVGQAVRTGQVLLVLEAMKMENEITSSRDGTVKRIHVLEGAKVSKNDPLVTLA